MKDKTKTPKYQKLPEEVRRASIVDAALTLFSSLGYQGTRMDDVAARAGLTKGGVYFHFKNKQQLFEAVIDDRIQRLETYLRELCETTGDVCQRIRLFFQILVSEMLENVARSDLQEDYYPGALELFLESMKLKSRTGRIRSLFAGARRELARMVRDGQEQGIFGPVDPELAAASAVAMTDGLYIQFVMDPKALDLVSSGERMADLFLDGLRAGAGENAS